MLASRPASGADLHGGITAAATTDHLRGKPARQRALLSFLVGLDDADAFELDDRLRRAVSLEQCLEARIGPLLLRVWDRWLHRALGYRTREAYARERLGMDPTRARALVRLERAAAAGEPFARAYRSGLLSWVKAELLVPLVSADPLGVFMEDWVAWAGKVTVRRLREDVEWALALEDTDPAAFRSSGGLPPEARGEPPGARGSVQLTADPDEPAGREIRAQERDPEGHMLPGPDRGIGAQHRDPGGDAAAETSTVRFFGPADIVQLFRAVLCTVRRRIEKEVGVHAARLRCLGRAPDGLTWQMGIRSGKPPLVAYRSGDRVVEGPQPARSAAPC